MTHLRSLRPRFASPAPVAAGYRPLRRFVADHAAGLRIAADLLGGKSHANAVDEIVDRLRHEPVPSRRTLRLLDELLLLMSLELVTDLESPEAEAFSLIDPADPIVAELCLLTDRLRATLAGLPTPSQPRTMPSARGRQAA
ncbi:hypothetical protein FHG66_05985 [Rubellimicrobium rubrum]|uniref:Uncharacterized protein n=1 Tax=Rubellimicrobium rubrum TaxID=2585369 RepID=A0A5C4N2E8_9RHOB|nr:hypothetical protein [Rubellimicrobium rubrum]TNC51101.1 hypothetical protein FHG66_05985 [Rubellimicrobium rubrum]